MNNTRKTRAVSLLSGGLDSMLAVKVLQSQGIEVVGLSFVTPFFGAKNAERSANDLGIELKVENITDPHLTMVKKPKHGYGKWFNPCVDCHAMMVQRAGVIMERERFDLIATGEVLGERPMSQNLQALMTVSKDSGYADYLLRPLSAKLLPETLPEREGKVDRTKLMDIQGRSRKPQMELADKFGIKSYIQPAGGCLLTDPEFTKRLKELFSNRPDAAEWDVRLLKLGRHFRFEDGIKVVVGRNLRDNQLIAQAARPEDALLITKSIPGPISLVVGGDGDAMIGRAASLTASYGDADGQPVEMELHKGGEVKMVKAVAQPRDIWKRFMI